jgi:hypothetical protein
MVIINTSTVEVSIQAVSPALRVSSARAMVGKVSRLSPRLVVSFMFDRIF